MGVSVGIIFSVETGEIILVKNILHKKPKWRIPGGTIEQGETPKEALVREIWEETGLCLDPTSVFPLMRILSKRATPHYYHVFGGFIKDFATLNRGPTLEKDSDTLLIAKEFKIQEATQKIVLPVHYIMLREGIKKINSLCGAT